MRPPDTPVVVLGTGGVFTRAVIDTLMQSDCRPRACVVPGYPPAPRPNTPGLRLHTGAMPWDGFPAYCAALNMPLLYAGDGSTPRFSAALHATEARVLLVACWPRRLPRSVHGREDRLCVNLHPSPLPRYRGPDPVFWQLRAGETVLGISLHRVSGELDAGPLLAQASVAVPEGGSRQAMDILLAKCGVDLFLRTLPVSTQTPYHQDGSQASYQGWPSAADFSIECTWSARRAFNFMRGTWQEGRRYRLNVAGGEYALGQALDLRPEDRAATPISIDDGVASIAMSPGILRAELSRD